MAARNGILVLGGMADSELDGIGRITPLTEQEAAMVRSWAAPPTWLTGTRHPGRGKYLIKSGERVGLPVALSLVETERRLYDTDQALHSHHRRPATRPGPARRRRRVCGDRAEPGTAAPDRDRRPAGPARHPGRRHGRDDRDGPGWRRRCPPPGTVPDWGGATVAALAEATRLANLDPLIGAHGSRGLFWTAVGAADRPGARRRRRGDLVVRRPRPVRDRGAVAGPPPRRARHGRAGRAAPRAAAAALPAASPPRRPGRGAGPPPAAGPARYGDAAGSARPPRRVRQPRKTCSWRSPGRGRTRPPPWWCPRCCPRSGRW